MLPTSLDPEIARALLPLVTPEALEARYLGLHGGRGGMKSHHFGERLIIMGYQKPVRWACIREYQKDLTDSVYQLLVDKIFKFGLEKWYRITRTHIEGPNGTRIIFRGMQSYNAENIKSLEGYDGAWVEEAQTLSARSLRMLRPTIRKPGSQIWFSWNPRFRTDPVDKFLRQEHPKNAIVLAVNWQDNPWFPDVLEDERQHDQRHEDESTYQHVWEGGYGVPKGSVLGRWVEQAEVQGRINNDVVYDPDGPGIEISSDIGFRDTAAWWFWQRRAGGYALLKYVGESGMDAEEWADELAGILEEKGWPLARINLPFDAKTKTFQSRYPAVEAFLRKFGQGKVSIVPQSRKKDQINAARKIMPLCEFHAEECADGLDGLRAWEFEFDEDKGVFSREPVHNFASHPGDGFAYGAQSVRDVPAPETPPPGPRWLHDMTADEVFWPKDKAHKPREWV